jgi:hypothetical protein
VNIISCQGLFGKRKRLILKIKIDNSLSIENTALTHKKLFLWMGYAMRFTAYIYSKVHLVNTCLDQFSQRLFFDYLPDSYPLACSLYFFDFSKFAPISNKKGLDFFGGLDYTFLIMEICANLIKLLCSHY